MRNTSTSTSTSGTREHSRVALYAPMQAERIAQRVAATHSPQFSKTGHTMAQEQTKQANVSIIPSDDEARAMRKKLAALAKAKKQAKAARIAAGEEAERTFTVTSEKQAINVYVSQAVNAVKAARRVAEAKRFLIASGNVEAAKAAAETSKRALEDVIAALSAVQQ